MKKLATALAALTWEEMDDFCAAIVAAATDDTDAPNDERYMAQVMVDFYTDTLSAE